MNSHEHSTDQKYGRFNKPEQLIREVANQFSYSTRTCAEIGQDCEVPEMVVLAIVNKTWGNPDWYPRPVTGIGNQNARKAPSERQNEILHLRVRGDEKRRWRAQAESMGMSLSRWVAEKLNSAIN